MVEEAYQVTFPLTQAQLDELRALPENTGVEIRGQIIEGHITKQIINNHDLNHIMNALPDDIGTLCFYTTDLFCRSTIAFQTFAEQLPSKLQKLELSFSNPYDEEDDEDNIADKLLLLMQNLPSSVISLVLNNNDLRPLSSTELQTFACAIPETVQSISLESSEVNELNFFKLIEHLPATIQELYIADNDIFNFEPVNLKNLLEILPRDIQMVDLGEANDLDTNVNFIPFIAEVFKKNPRLNLKGIWLDGQNLLAQIATPAVTVLGKRSSLFSNPHHPDNQDDEGATPAKCSKP